MSRYPWWFCGLVGAFTLSLVTAIKGIRALVKGAAEGVDWSEIGGFAAAIFGMGFVCGLVVWAGQGLSRRFGVIGDALVGLVVMEIFFVCCMLLFEPEMLGTKFTESGLPMLGLAVPAGLFGGWYIARDLRKDFAEEERARERRRRLTEDD